VEADGRRILNSESGAKKFDPQNFPFLTVSDLPEDRLRDFRVAMAPAEHSTPISGWSEGSAQRSPIHHLAMCAAVRRSAPIGILPPKMSVAPTGTMIARGSAGCPVLPIRRCFSRSAARARYRLLHYGRLIKLASGYVSIEHGLKGPNMR